MPRLAHGQLVAALWAALLGSSEIDLTHDKNYKNYAGLVGVKIVLGIDYVVVYKTSSQAATSIDLYRCSPERPP